MSRRRAFVVGSGAFVLGLVVLACSDDPDRPPATSSGGTTSSGAGSSASSGGGPTDGSAQDGSSSGSDGGSNSSSGSSSGFIETGLRGSVDAVATEFDVTPTAVRQSSGFVIELSGKSAAGDELRITMTSGTGMLAPGAYNCTGGSGDAYSVITYTTTGGTETWSAVANGACTASVQSIDNQAGGITVGTFTATVQKGGSPNKTITNGQFRLTLD